VIGDRVVQIGLRAGYCLVARTARRLGPPTVGGAVAVWHGGRLLVVRHSYRDGWGLPGGRIRRGETAAEGAARELSEEVGIACPADELDAAFDITGRGLVRVFEYHPRRAPAVRVDRREVVAAAFLDPRAAAQRPIDLLLRIYLRRCRILATQP